MPESFVLIDVPNCLHRLYYVAASRMACKVSMVNDITYMFLRDLGCVASTLGSSDFVFCFDSDSSLRKNIYPDYKANRDFNDLPHTTVRSVASNLQNVLDSLGYQNLKTIEGLEADDLIGYYCNKAAYTSVTGLVILSTDQDFYQLLNDTVSIWNPSKKVTITHNTPLPVLPESWVRFKSIIGCKADNIPGVPGVGEHTAANYVNGKAPSSRELKKYEKIRENKEFTDNNSELVELPFPYFDYNSLDYFCLQSDKEVCSRWDGVVQKHGFTSLLGRYPRG